jgi:predicted amidohydrolase YtcJ
MENDAGSIEVDKYADLIVIDRNLFKIPETEISEANVVLTLLDGELVYGDWDMKVLKKTAL